MRCLACNVLLTDYETTRKSIVTNEYFDLCNNCFKTIKDDLVYKDRADLANANDMYAVEESNDDDEFKDVPY